MAPVEALKEKAREWASEVVKLHNTPFPPELQGDKTKLLNRAKTIKNGIEKIFGTLDELTPIAQIQELGAIPVLVPAAVIAASSAAIAKWYYDNKKIITRLNAYNELKRGGLSNDQAIKLINGRQSVIASVKSALIPAALITTIYFVTR